MMILGLMMILIQKTGVIIFETLSKILFLIQVFLINELLH